VNQEKQAVGSSDQELDQSDTEEGDKEQLNSYNDTPA